MTPLLRWCTRFFRFNGRLVEVGDALTRPLGLTSIHWQVLGVVEHGPSPVSHVARLMGLSRQRVQKTADILAQDGFIVYTKNPHHRRAKMMQPTAKGETVMVKLAERQAAWASNLAAAHDPVGLEAALPVLRNIREGLEAETPSFRNA
jgi:DNA-binding MarR family transcriptional regulator